MTWTPEQLNAQEGFRNFVDEAIVPFADLWDRDERLPEGIVRALAERGYLGATIPTRLGGGGYDSATFGLFCEEIGRGSASLLSLLTVHGMVCQALTIWGSDEQQQKWLPRLATGATLGAFALTEPNIGSDAKNVETVVTRLEDGTYRLDGRKKWISCGQIADLFLVFGQLDNKPVAFLVEKDRPGFSRAPLSGLLGFRAAMLAELTLDGCVVPEGNMVGRPGFGFTHVAGAALDHGRFCVGCGCVGLARGCLEACLDYTSERKQFGVHLREHPLIQRMLTDMITHIEAARLLCVEAGSMKDARDPRSIMATSTAKYFASTMAARISSDAVQIHGANGCGPEYPVQRHFRDAKIMEIIEGSNQIQQTIIAKFGHLDHVRDQRVRSRKGARS
ncbi:Butyryl-CoA dehydrogenase [Candidatus Magnetaquicoccaceae bacterium FCR-1]|uniref:Butyryl-CoA dehydrogenase n=1 Tax=Candidatus Magnetaquiglobus chichijimensis TaxID=3141448 RepID=A0ABQ0C6F4_9PROT